MMQTPNRISLFVSMIVAALLVACPADDPEPVSVDKPDDGKEDSVDRLCRDAGQPDGCDICAIRGWYGDGECDDYCTTPDPDCSPVEPELVCSWDTSTPFGQSTADLNDHVTGSVTYTVGDVDEMPVIDGRQIVVALTHLDFMEGNEDLTDAFQHSDDDDFRINEVTVGGHDYDWIKFYAGDTQIGVIFESNTVTIVAEVSDGDIMGCTNSTTEPEPEPELEFDCTGNTEPPFTNDSDELIELATSQREVLIDDVDDLTEMESRQIYAALSQLLLITGDEDFDVVFDAVDEGSLAFIYFEDEGVAYDWVSAYAGDTEVGVIFMANSLEIVGEVGDGDIAGCISR